MAENAHSTPVSAAEGRTLHQVLFDMDGDVGDLVNWGILLRDLGTGEAEVDARGLFVLAGAVHQTALRVRSNWEKAFQLSRPLCGGTR